jgi:hypothetical protein
MALYSMSGVSVESWVEVDPTTTVSVELDEPNDAAILYFGDRKDFVLNLAGKALRDVAALSSQAATALGAR